MAYTKPKKTEIPSITLQPIDRSYKGVDQWRAAIKAAEDLYYPSNKKKEDLFKEIKIDSHLTSIVGKRQDNITNRRLVFYNNDGSENEDITNLMDTEAAEDMIKDLLDSRFHGHTLLWFNSITKEKIDYKVIDRAHVRPSTKEVLNMPYDMHGVKYNEKPVSNYVLEAGKPGDLGLFIVCAIWVIYKKGGVADLALFAESFGSPFREYIYEDPSVKAALEKAAQDTGAASYVVRPSNAEFKLHETTNKGGSKDLFIGLADLCDHQMSKAILRNTMTTDAVGGNYKGEVHEKSEKAVIKADKRYITRLLNEKFIPLLETFGIKAEGRFSFEGDDPVDFKSQFEIDMKFVEKFEVDPEYYYKKYNQPIPKGGAALRNKSGIPDAKEDPKEEDPKDTKSGKDKTTKLNAREKRTFVSLVKNLFSWLPWVE
jgi:phage gp29-like protein